MIEPVTAERRPEDLAFQLLIIDAVPYDLLNQVSEVDVIQHEIRRSLAQASLEVFQADGALVRIRDLADDRKHLRRLRANNPTLPLIGVAGDGDDEPVALELLGDLLDDYLLDGHANTDHVVHAFRQARRLRMAELKIRSLNRANECLRRTDVDRRVGMELLSQMLQKNNHVTSEVADQIRVWLDELRDANSPRRQRCSVADCLAAADRDDGTELRVTGNRDLRTYLDPKQIGNSIRETLAAVSATTADLTISPAPIANEGVQVVLKCRVPDNLSANLIPHVLARFPRQTLVDESRELATVALRLSFAKRLAEQNLSRWFISIDHDMLQVRWTLPAADAATAFHRYGDRLLVTHGPDSKVTLLQVRLPETTSRDGSELQSILGSDEFAYPASERNWLVALTSESDTIDRRLRRLWSDWRNVAAGRRPLITRPIGQWALPEKRDEMLALVQTVVELGDLSIESHPKLLLVRPESASPTSLDTRLEAAGYQVITTPEERFNDVMHDCDPDAVIVACDHEQEAIVNRSIAESMESVAKIPVVLMTASARSIQRNMRRDISPFFDPPTTGSADAEQEEASDKLKPSERR